MKNTPCQQRIGIGIQTISIKQFFKEKRRVKFVLNFMVKINKITKV